MKFKEAVKDTNKSLIKLIKHDHWELREAWAFYKQSFSDFIYATKYLLRWFLVVCCLPAIPLLYIYAVIIRMVKK